jgi:hypothetical protein
MERQDLHNRYFSGSHMSQRVEHNATNEHHLYMVLFITNGGGI